MKAYELLSDESKWFGNGKLNEPEQLCAAMAINRCYVMDRSRDAALKKLRLAIGGHDIVGWNDTHTYAEVHAKLKELDI